ncbi:MAG TPA: RDD family protein [Pyrinomonadaceae bacterium]|nr:RDD family protein [Pyrinomonadaceae bacterium]
MEYYVYKDGANLGPLPEAYVSDAIRSGRFLPHDLGCRVGESRWQDLSVLFPFEAPQPQPGRATGPVYQQSAPRQQQQFPYSQPAPMVPVQNNAQANYPGGDFLLGPRLGALLIDGLCAMPLVWMAIIPFLGIIGAPLLCAYWISRDSFFGGQSIGKKALGLKVIKPDGSPFVWADSVKRNLVYFGYLVLMIPWLGIILNAVVNVPLGIIELIMVLTSGQRLGDKQGGTYVVRA